MNSKKTTQKRKSPYFPICALVSATLVLAACSSDNTENSGAAPTGSPNPPVQTPNDPLTGPNEVPGESRATAIGDVLVFGNDNRTLYTFANDTQGQSNCTNGCAVTWPPITAQAETNIGDFSTIVRVDESLQWAFRGVPLYYYAGDANELETNGDGLGGVWYVARPDPVSTGSTEIGTVLVGKGSISTGGDDPAVRSDYDGRTLYVFANDTADTSNCNNGCAANWPPLFADRGAVAGSGYTVISREDGSTQWAYESQPLYFYAGDSAPGETNGQGVNGTWSVATPNPQQAFNN